MLFFLAGVLPYVTLVILVGGLWYRLNKWAHAPTNLHWELFPYPKTSAGRLGELLREVVTMRLLATFNRKLWLPSTAMHWGIYLVIVWLVWLLTGLPGSAIAGVLGGFLVMLGSGLLMIQRMTRTELRDISTPLDLLTLALLFFTAATASAGRIFSQGELVREYLLSLVTMAPRVPGDPYFLTSLVLLQLFLIYLPFGKMAHFGAKYFTYHKVKWGETHE